MSYSVKLEEGDEPVKARTKKVTFKADDPSTPNIDEEKESKEVSFVNTLKQEDLNLLREAVKRVHFQFLDQKHGKCFTN